MEITPLLSLLIIQAAVCFHLDSQNKDLLVLQNKENRLAPFVIKDESADSENSGMFSLDIECPTKSDFNIVLSNSISSICPKATRVGSALELNDFLGKLNIPMIPTNETSVIQYTVSTNSDEREETRVIFQQKVREATLIPTTLAQKTISIFPYDSQVELKFLVLSIKRNYMTLSETDNLEVEIRDRPSWLTVNFAGADLYFLIAPEKRLLASFSISLQIFDRVTGLSSNLKSIEINFQAQGSQSEEWLNTELLYFITLFCIFGALIGVLVKIILSTRTPKQEPRIPVKKAKAKELFSMESTATEQSLNEKSTVLTDSIIDWERKNLATQTRKAPEHQEGFKEDQESCSSLSISAKYQQFEESDQSREESVRSVVGGFTDISEIDEENSITAKSQDENQSSIFMEDLKM